MEPAILNPPIPYIGFINGGFRPGRILRVQGRINHNSHGFKIELLSGSNPNHDDVGLHLNPRFSENVVIRNSRSYSSWGTEERQGIGFPFLRGQVFEVLILCEVQEFKIAINGQHYTEFSHRVPVDKISHLAVDGDITISMIQFDGKSDTPSQSLSSSAPPPLQPTSDSVATAPPLVMGGNYGDNFSGYPPQQGHGSSGIGFVPPPYPTGNAGAPSYPQPYMSGPPMYPPPGQSYPPPGQSYSPPGQSYPPPGQSYPPPGGYPGQYSPQPPYGAYPNQPGGYYPGPQQQPYQQQSSGGGLMDSAGKLLTGFGLGGVASKIPGMGGQRSGGHGQGGSSGGFPGGVGGAAAGLGALGVGGMLAAKVLKPKKMKKNKMLKYGIPLAGVGLGGYALHKGMRGFHRRSSSSSSSD